MGGKRLMGGEEEEEEIGHKKESELSDRCMKRKK